MKTKILFFLCMAAMMLVITGCNGGSSTGETDTAIDNGTTTDTDTTTNTTTEEAGIYEGYSLFAPMNTTETFLIDTDGNTVHSWDCDYKPGLAVYFLENGELLRTGNAGNTTFTGGGSGGVVQLLDWDSQVLWEYSYSDTTHLSHHDVEMLPNGNVLIIAWEYKSKEEALAAGRDSTLLSNDNLWPDSIIEVEPTGLDSGDIVWEWHVWDHLVQDYDNTKSNYGVVADHPERIDLNYTMNGNSDWNHINSVDYSETYDQILLSVHNFSEIWIIDHSTTTAEAAGHSGGNSGMGGDLLYRWGNPQTYDETAGDDDQQLFVQHDAEWIEDGLPGAGNILIFNNGNGRSDGNYSSVDEIEPPVNSDGSYTLSASHYGPNSAAWTYVADTLTDFYAQNISGAQRLPNGNTLICQGPDGYFFEVTEEGETLWDYDAGAAVFRVTRYAPDYAGFDGTELDDEKK